MLCAELNRKILKLAPKHLARDIAPNTFKELASNTVSGLVVWSGASDKTVYGDPMVNWAMRAWHDSIHLKINAEFNSEGEKRVGLEQARLIGSDRLGLILVAEVIGQVEYFDKYGSFPIDQVQFVSNYMKGKI